MARTPTYFPGTVKADAFDGPISSAAVEALVPLGGTITGATANNTMTAVADATAASTDTSAASLTSVNAAIAAIENNFADLQAKVNAIIDALQG
jgi:hypothetical protein